MATVLSGASEHVWEVEGDVVSGCERGEVKGRTMLTVRVRALARFGRAHVAFWRALDVTGAWRSRRCSASTGQGRCPSCSAKQGESPGHDDACWMGEERRMAWLSGMRPRHGLVLDEIMLKPCLWCLAWCKGCRRGLMMT